MTQHPLKDVTFVHCTEKPHVFPSETSSKDFAMVSIAESTLDCFHAVSCTDTKLPLVDSSCLLLVPAPFNFHHLKKLDKVKLAT